MHARHTGSLTQPLPIGVGCLSRGEYEFDPPTIDPPSFALIKTQLTDANAISTASPHHSRPTPACRGHTATCRGQTGQSRGMSIDFCTYPSYSMTIRTVCSVRCARVRTPSSCRRTLSDQLRPYAASPCQRSLQSCRVPGAVGRKSSCGSDTLAISPTTSRLLRRKCRHSAAKA